MKNYRDFDKVHMGETDIATILLSYTINGTEKTFEIATGEDSRFSAYYIEGEAEIGSHYNLIFEAECVNKASFSDEDGENSKFEYDEEKTIRLYRAGVHGFILQVL